jgi:type 1 glutamine amidotransferase
MQRLALCLAICLSTTLTATADEKPKLKGLLITGGCCHDYNNQKKIIAEGLAQRLSIAFDVVHEGGTGRNHKVSVYSEPGWARKYDVIVHNECFGGVADDDFVKSIAQAHYEGVPAVFIHCSLHSYRAAPNGADAWRELIGVTSRRHEKHRAVLVKNVHAEHPVMAGVPLEWKTPAGELYIIEKHWPNCVPLAMAYGQDTKQIHTVAWTNNFGKARVFGTSLGHHNETMNNDVWLGMFARGVLWACDKLEDNGDPKPGFAGTGIKPIKLPGLKAEPDPVSKKPKTR